ncbi:peptide deformylase [Laribacter hongkongensis]|uniref:Peptide deformylase n=1 Tax=Laribacter hongkongensis TaxID=168471 RepID=A0A248LNP2_9NEIS|nr:peptide deformylase [Laribacter hongkongensis]ASJ26165.1 peptide deformylase [Laribacter hongkongensis]MCG9024971.1 peptide deformylase [Laribacter hongkongensis]MCG9041163.1 peptide deformylase [Laribacter hongkongensis]MCG9052176.1 peptide deformylase [Laribacter hongkongensis]MCG9055567.1 peptide deformylase [Laribacter hongkongensis]
MALLNILHYPDERLHTVARPVDVVDDALRRLIDDMAETMYAAHGIGLAATQIDCHRRLVVIDLSEEHDDLLVLINPVITRKAGETVYEEGCLSVPGIYDKVTRAETVTVEALDRNGQPFSLDAEGLLAICIQHEIDHLDGKVFVEHLSQMKQSRIKQKLKKRERQSL